MSIQLENITKVYGKQKALENLTFTAEEGQILGLLGPNGAGKTTCMKIISCFMPQSSGNVSVYGMKPESSSLEIRRILGYLPEHNPLYENMYVKEYLEFVAGIHDLKDKSKYVEEAIEKTGLSLEQNKLISSLSKGYKQRVGIAQAIIHNPKVLILDEPISGLDPNQIIEIRELIKKLKEDKVVIFSSHILQEVESLCDKVVILDKGHKVADDKVVNIASGSTARSNIIIEFKDKFSSDLLEGLDSDIKFERITDRKFVIHEYAIKNIQEELFDLAVSNNNKLIELHSTTQSLESVFKSLTRNR